MADPLEIAKLAVYLASDDSAYVVGADFLIDGGVTPFLPWALDRRTRAPSHSLTGGGYWPSTMLVPRRSRTNSFLGEVWVFAYRSQPPGLHHADGRYSLTMLLVPNTITAATEPGTI